MIQLKFRQVNSALIPDRKPSEAWAGTARTSKVLRSKPPVPLAARLVAKSPLGTVMSGFTAMYFSFTTLMTLGYGDITPVADVARMLAMLEAMTGTLFVGVMIARLVCLYSAAGHTRTPSHSEGEHTSKFLALSVRNSFNPARKHRNPGEPWNLPGAL